MSEMVMELSDATFDQAIAEGIALVDFWAPWCGPCRMIAPVVEELASENGESIKVAKVNIDDCPNIAANYGVSSIPTIMLFKDGNLVDQFVGVQPKNRLQDAITNAVG